MNVLWNNKLLKLKLKNWKAFSDKTSFKSSFHELSFFYTTRTRNAIYYVCNDERTIINDQPQNEHFSRPLNKDHFILFHFILKQVPTSLVSSQVPKWNLKWLIKNSFQKTNINIKNYNMSVCFQSDWNKFLYFPILFTHGHTIFFCYS